MEDKNIKNLLKSRRLIRYSIEGKIGGIGIGDISVILTISSIKRVKKIYILVPKKLKKKNIPDLSTFIIPILYNGDCECVIKTYEDFEKELILENKKHLLSEDGIIIYDLENKYRKIIESAKKKKNSFSIIKLFYRMCGKSLHLNRVC